MALEPYPRSIPSWCSGEALDGLCCLSLPKTERRPLGGSHAEELPPDMFPMGIPTRLRASNTESVSAVGMHHGTAVVSGS